MTASQRLKSFLEAEDLDDLLSAKAGLDDLDEQDRQVIRSILGEWQDTQAVSNLLMHPSAIPRDMRLHAILRGLDEMQEIYYVLASIVGLQSIVPETLSEEEISAVVQQLLDIIEDDDGVFAARASVSILAFLKEKDAINVFRFVQHPNKVVSHNAIAWLIGTLGSGRIGEITAIAEASGMPRETAEYVKDKFREHTRNMETKGVSRLVMPLYAYIPNLRDVQR